MKVFELLHDNVKVISEEAIIERMKKFDWKYEFSEDITRVVWGNRELELIENIVYGLYKKDPEKAVKLWNENSPEGPADKTIIPSFIIRLSSQDKSK